MALPDTLSVGLKEWAVVCHALATGRQIILLRKGGIHEAAGGFELEHPRFLLFPTYLHQNLEMLKQGDEGAYERRSAEPEQIALSAAAEVSDIVQLKSRAQMDAIDGEHVWTAPLIDMRFNYRPQNPLYLLLVRAYRLPAVTTVENTPAYAGCKSWVPLDQTVRTAGARPACGDAAYETRRRSILSLVAQHDS
jgi:hypothetical protein